MVDRVCLTFETVLHLGSDNHVDVPTDILVQRMDEGKVRAVL